MKAYTLLGILFVLIIASCNKNQNNTSKDRQSNTKQKMEVIKGQGIITKVSSQNFENTCTSLVDVITKNPNLKIVAQLDHHANAASVDLPLNPTKIIMFGNPRLGTPLMQSSLITGLDLPQKILIWQDNDVVKVSYNDPGYLKERHGIEGKDEILQKIKGALDALTNKAINP